MYLDKRLPGVEDHVGIDRNFNPFGLIVRALTYLAYTCCPKY